MAVRGAKPKPTHLKLVLGDPGKRGIPEGEPAPTGDLGVRPTYLRGRARSLWDEVAPKLWWLGDADAFKLGLWCNLQAEFEKAPRQMIAGRIAQLRALGSELGMDPASRARFNVSGHGRKTKAKDEFFDD